MVELELGAVLENRDNVLDCIVALRLDSFDFAAGGGGNQDSVRELKLGYRAQYRTREDLIAGFKFRRKVPFFLAVQGGYRDPAGNEVTALLLDFVQGALDTVIDRVEQAGA